MAEVVLASGSERSVWSRDFLKSYTRQSGFAPYMGRGDSSIIRVRRELQNEAGALINVPLILELRGRGVEGAEVLEGNEEEMENVNDQIRINWRRNGVVVPKSTSFKTEIDLLNAARERLVIWAKNRLRDDVINALQSVIIPGVVDIDGNPTADSAVLYANATAAQRNAYLAANIDRFLFGSSTANSVSGNWATSLANVDTAADKMSATVIDMAKSMAKKTTNNANGMAMNPYQSDATAGREWFVMFMSSEAFSQAARDPVIIENDRVARVQGVDTNPVFQGGDRIHNGVILREIPELTPIRGAGAAGADVDRSFLCGAGALAVAYGQDPTPKSDRDRDYGFRPGVAIEELRGQKKVSYSGVNYGVVEVLTASTAIGS
ncbi:MAG TPA: DUF4043 family protein [Sphingomicrobium sp.]